MRGTCRLALLSILGTLSACGSMNLPSCPTGQDEAVQELLYFGTDKPGGRVTAEDWAQFLGETVTPRFPEGLTAWQASGQWLSATGTLVREPSYVLSLVHPRGAATESAIRELIASYKARFQQEAVLRVSAHACITL